MTKMRHYQRDILDTIYSDLHAEHNVLMTAATGAGKTAMAVKLVERLYNEKPRSNYLVVMHKKLLVTQFLEAFSKFTDINPADIGVCCAGLHSRNLSKRITISTIQTIHRNRDAIKKQTMILVDECHRAEFTNKKTRYAQLLEAIRGKAPQSRLLGITATPYRLGAGYCYGTRCRPDIKNLFPRVNAAATYEMLKKDGYLVPLVGKIASHSNISEDLAGLRINGDYNISQAGDVMSREYHIDTAVEAIRDNCPGRDCIVVFCVTIDHCEKVFSALKNSGESVTIIHSQLTPLEQHGNMESWREGKARIMVSCEILIDGFDHPPLDCLVMLRPTLSAALYIQSIGRVLRPSEGKSDALLLDLTDNVSRFGTDLDNVRVTIPKAAEEIVKKEKELIKICPACQAEVSIYRRDCDCGYEWTAEEIQIATAVPELTDVIFEKEPPLVVKCNSAEPSIHESRKTKKQLGKLSITYGESYQAVSVYFCLADYYSGYAVTMSKKRWQDVSNSTFPTTVDEFMTCDFILPESLELDLNGKFPDIVKINMGTEAVSNYSDEIPF